MMGNGEFGRYISRGPRVIAKELRRSESHVSEDFEVS